MGKAKQEVEAKQEEKEGEKAEEKKVEKAEEKKEEAKPAGPPPPVVLSLDLHCVGCAEKIEKCILKCRGVESVEVDMKQNLVTVKGMVDPQALCSRIHKRTQRQVQVLSPLPPADGDSKPEAARPQESGMATVELLVTMHCEACAEHLKRKILKMRGVQTAETDMTAGKVTVTGTVTGEKIVEYIHRRTGKIANIVPPPPKEEEEEEEKKREQETKPKENAPEVQENASEKTEDGGKEEEKGEGSGGEANAGITSVGQEDMAKRMMYYWHSNGNFMGEEEMTRRRMVHWMPVYMIEQPPPPQLFSDENPNACCIT
ncbi:heavy metal-associated isoprenylated plant protein 9 [Curcuma longa]|uniref:heavy metal-associated isoprenylated plant protein 9 n=1 Tax=Curcuma longa TaxID=136217 RepID=UPI003D9E4F46